MSEKRGKLMANMQDKNLDQCPFCGSNAVRVVKGIGAGFYQPIVLCADCGVTVSFHEAFTYIELMDSWNRRGEEND